MPYGERSVPYRRLCWEVASRIRPAEWPATETGLYMELVTFRYFKSLGSLSALATALTIIGLYFLGRFVTARMGQWVVSRFETLVLARVPIISSVYSSVKQVTDFFFSERPIAYNRVVAVEFPRRGVWTIGFAMGESLMEMTLAAGEPMVSIMIPAAPMPMTGWVVTVPKSAIIDLNMTLDQAFQYFLSCGVLRSPNINGQLPAPELLLHRELARRLSQPRSAHQALADRTTAGRRESHGGSARRDPTNVICPTVAFLDGRFTGSSPAGNLPAGNPLPGSPPSGGSPPSPSSSSPLPGPSSAGGPLRDDKVPPS